MKGVRRPALIFAVVSTLYWSGIGGLLAIIYPLSGKDVAPFWMVSLINFVPAALYAVTALFFCHWLARRAARRLDLVANAELAGPGAMILPIENNCGAQMSVMLEPHTDTVEIAPGQVAEIVMPTLPDTGELQIDYHDEQWLSVWVPPNASIRIRKD